MSGAIWGVPLWSSLVSDSYERVFNFIDVSNLNDWTVVSQTTGSTPWSFHSEYDDNTRNNLCTITCRPNNWETIIFPISIKAGNTVAFSLEYQGPEYELLINESNIHSGGITVAIAEHETDSSWTVMKHSYSTAIIPKEKVDEYKRFSVRAYFYEDVTVYLHIGFADVRDSEQYQFNFRNIKCQLIPGYKPISYAQKPFNLNMLDGDIWNFIAVEPGAWFYSIYDDRHTHHVYFLAGNEFKLLEFTEAAAGGVIPHEEHYSTPLVINGSRYHALHVSWPAETVCPFPTQYYPLDEMPSDEDIYSELIPYVREVEPYERGDVLGLWALRDFLSTHLGEADGYWLDIGDVKSLLKGYTVATYQNPYLDDPRLDNPDYYQETHKQ